MHLHVEAPLHKLKSRKQSMYFCAGFKIHLLHFSHPYTLSLRFRRGIATVLFGAWAIFNVFCWMLLIVMSRPCTIPTPLARFSLHVSLFTMMLSSGCVLLEASETPVPARQHPPFSCVTMPLSCYHRVRFQVAKCHT